MSDEILTSQGSQELKKRLPRGAIKALATSLAAGGRLLLQGEPHEGADANLRWLR